MYPDVQLFVLPALTSGVSVWTVDRVAILSGEATLSTTFDHRLSAARSLESRFSIPLPLYCCAHYTLPTVLNSSVAGRARAGNCPLLPPERFMPGKYISYSSNCCLPPPCEPPSIHGACCQERSDGLLRSTRPTFVEAPADLSAWQPPRRTEKMAKKGESRLM